MRPVCSSLSFALILFVSALCPAQQSATPASQGPPSRADFVSTNDTPRAAVYDRTHQRVFVSNPVAGTVDVLSSTTYQLLRSIPVPAPAGLDIGPNNSTIFVGSSTQAVYSLDTATLVLTGRFVLPPVQLTPTVSRLEPPVAPIATPDGCVLLSTSTRILKWNPATNNVSTVFTKPPQVFGYGPVSATARSADHTKVILSDNHDPSTVYIYDAVKDQFSAPYTVQGFVYSVAANPTGTQFAIAEELDSHAVNIVLLDASLKRLAIVQGGGYLQWSLDGKYIYIVGDYGNVPSVGTLDAKTLKLLGVAPSYASAIAYTQRYPPLAEMRPFAVDETGRVFGGADHGLAIDDATDLRSYTGKEEYPENDIVAEPDDGPLNQPQPLSIASERYDSVPSIWFGQLQASGTSVSGPHYMTTIAPAASKPGPVNIRIEGADQLEAWIPQAYTYGAVFSRQPDLAGPAAGDAQLDLFGYGLAADEPSVPASLSIGNQPATLSGTHIFPAQREYPFPLWHLTAKAPKLPAGSATIAVTTPWAKASMPAAYHALDIRSYALKDTIYGLAYDRTRQRVYLAATDHIDVFALSTRTWLAPIQVPTQYNMKQLGGIAITPDGKWLAVANYSDNSVALFDAANPSNATLVPTNTLVYPSNFGPSTIAATSAGRFFIGFSGVPWQIPLAAGRVPHHPAPAASPRPANTNVTWPYPIWQLDIEHKSVAPYKGIPGGPEFPALASSPDGNLVSFCGESIPYSVLIPGTGQLNLGPWAYHPPFCVPGNGRVATINPSIPSFNVVQVDNTKLNTLMRASIPDVQLAQLPGDWVIGLALEPSGALAFQPEVSGISVWDMHTGELREVVSLATNLTEIFSGSLVASDTGEQLAMITSAGLTVVQFDSLPLAIGSVIDRGDTWTIAGTGFVSGTTVTVDGKPLIAHYIDAGHLLVSGTPGLNSFRTVRLSNPDGHTYTYDAAYLR